MPTSSSIFILKRNKYLYFKNLVIGSYPREEAPPALKVGINRLFQVVDLWDEIAFFRALICAGARWNAAVPDRVLPQRGLASSAPIHQQPEVNYLPRLSPQLISLER